MVAYLKYSNMDIITSTEIFFSRKKHVHVFKYFDSMKGNFSPYENHIQKGPKKP